MIFFIFEGALSSSYSCFCVFSPCASTCYGSVAGISRGILPWHLMILFWYWHPDICVWGDYKSRYRFLGLSCLDGFFLASFSVLSMNFWRMWGLCGACFIDLLSCYVHSERLLVLEARIYQRIGERRLEGDICGPRRLGRVGGRLTGVPLQHLWNWLRHWFYEYKERREGLQAVYLVFWFLVIVEQEVLAWVWG